MSNFANPKIFGVRLTMLLFLYRRRLRAHPVQELLAGTGIAVGVALVFGVLLANTTLTSSADQLVHGLSGSARLALVARSSQGFPESMTTRVRQLSAVQLATPILRENMKIVGPRGQRAIQLIGVAPSLASLGGLAQQQLGNGALLLSGGLGLPTVVAKAIGAKRHSAVRVISNGYSHSSTVGVVIAGETLKAIAGSPVAVALLPVAQRLTERPGRATEMLVDPRQGQVALAKRQLQSVAGGRIGVVPADNELRLLNGATAPNRQSTTLFSAISVMVGFLLALNAMLLTVPERRRFIAELRMQGYEPRQVLLLLGTQAILLGLAASIVGVLLGDLLAHTIFNEVPTYLSVAFPVGAQQSVHVGIVFAALACGVLATMLASLSPAFDLRPGRPADAVFREAGSGGGLIPTATLVRCGLIGVALIALVELAVAVDSKLTIVGGVVLAFATLCLLPAMLAGVARLAPRLAEGSRSGAVIVAVSELRAITTRSIALAAIAGLAVYGSVAIGGARNDLLRGIDRAISEYHSSADIWVTAGGNVFNTDSFRVDGSATSIRNEPGVRSVRIYRGSLVDIGPRRLWVRARPAGDPLMIEPSQMLSGNYRRAEALLRRGGWAAVSSEFAAEHHLSLGSTFGLPTPTGEGRLRVAAITTNSGWPAGTISMAGADYSRWWGTGEASALEIDLKPGTSLTRGMSAVRAALGTRTGLLVRGEQARASEAEASARQGLRTLSQISSLLLIAAALAVAAALSATVWQRRTRLASLKIQGYNPGQLWRGLLLESSVMLSVGSLVGAIVGVYGHALAAHWLTITTGFPAPFAVGTIQVFLTFALVSVIALAVISVPGLFAARVPARVSLQD